MVWGQRPFLPRMQVATGCARHASADAPALDFVPRLDPKGRGLRQDEANRKKT